MECFAEQQRDHKWAMRKIVRNDPTVTTFYINAEMVYDWGMLGTVVVRNTQLTEIILFNEMGMGNIPDNAVRDFASGLVSNRSIQTLNIANWNHYDRDYPHSRVRDFPHSRVEAWKSF